MRTIILILLLPLLIGCGSPFSDEELVLHGEAAKNNCRIRLSEQGYGSPDFAAPLVQYGERDIIVVEGLATARTSGERVFFTCTVDRTAFNDHLLRDRAGEEVGTLPEIPVEIEFGEP